ncbi:hypothetical protein TcasGA2_TC033185 [Tribolium castaneum]|uniref:Secreted protein n=1 Tax=Tribolium castaneum TaxID=7070 RepID=A0A139WHH3_TRICA|nr:hypothetical protein TcasGA2_TC033185 [Tribolium castaneum]
MMKLSAKKRCAIFVNFTMTLFLGSASSVVCAPEIRGRPPEFSQRISPQCPMATWTWSALSFRSPPTSRSSCGGRSAAGWICLRGR